MGKLALANIRLFNLIKTEVDVKRSEKEDFVLNLKKEFSSSSSVIVAKYSGLTVSESESLSKEMRANMYKKKTFLHHILSGCVNEFQPSPNVVKILKSNLAACGETPSLGSALTPISCRHT